MAALAAAFYSFGSCSPLADSCWSLHTGPDGRVYAAACVEHSPGQTATVVRYNDATDSLDPLFDMDEATGDLRDSGRATQCKIHYSFAPAARSGLLYAATHLSGPAKGARFYDAWAGWHDAAHGFRGAYLVAWDTRTDEVVRSELMIPHEGCRCLCLDEERERLYAVTYPRDHFVIYDLARQELRDVGRIGSVNTQALFLDRKHRVFLTNDRGRFVRYDPAADRLEELPVHIPYDWFQDGWHGVLYDAVADPEEDCVYAVPWMVAPRLMRYWPADGPHGRVEDLGPVTQACDRHHPVSMSLEHVGGLVFGCDGWLYFVKATWSPGSERNMDFRHAVDVRGVLMRMDPKTLVQEEAGVLERPDGSSGYVSRGARDRHGHLYFGHVGKVPVGLFRVAMPAAARAADAHLPLRPWG